MLLLVDIAFTLYLVNERYVPTEYYVSINWLIKNFHLIKCYHKSNINFIVD